MTRRRAALGVTAVAALGVAAAAFAWRPDAPASGTRPAQWAEVAWPFPNDPFGKGKAFRCKRAECGADVTLYVRAKIGFCNCTTGVADDEELDRIGDLDLIGTGLSHVGDGKPISVAWMKGRSRAYASAAGTGPARSGLSIGFNDRCDAIIATAVLDRGTPAAIEPAVLAFLNSHRILRWAEVTLGL